MKVAAFIQDKFQSFGITVSEAETLEMSINGGIDLNADLTAENMKAVSVAIAGFIPSLLLRPQSVSEGGFSMSFNAQSLKDFYSSECARLGIENLLSGVRDASDCW